jgi:uncharacterized protein YdeI (BOF family)
MAAVFSNAENVMVTLNGGKILFRVSEDNLESEDNMNEMKVMWFQRVWNKMWCLWVKFYFINLLKV